MNNRRVVVGISGASGVAYGVRALEMLAAAGVETHLVMSQAAQVTLAHETRLKVRDVVALAAYHYAHNDIAAPIASGSFRAVGMIVAPCSVRTLAEIATGVTSGLLSRAADVVLKERRPLVLMVRETPLHLGHLRNMVAATEMGAIVYPPVPAFYAAPKSVAEIIEQSVGRALDCLGIDAGKVRRWGVDIGPRPRAAKEWVESAARRKR